ncbi:hypothetical protein HYPSUDRAFT_54220 [Hypholoma sublateritium FD-334 SS-4]|uniref:Uncharacterized protein n=1 Tax=Hypholoma sublateritium (strain FD-334 SS-4) TaxID=945553 RepID=A0A0D2MJE8_HYPSF|nr:hypothetical protein HYPSUDRAFT_54220 [Hypholoma sublateritium FD-334 SS-4]
MRDLDTNRSYSSGSTYMVKISGTRQSNRVGRAVNRANSESVTFNSCVQTAREALHEKSTIGTPFIARCAGNLQSTNAMYYMQSLMRRFTDEEVKTHMEGMLQMDMDNVRIELWKLSSLTAAELTHVGVSVGIVDMLMKCAVKLQKFEMEYALFPTKETGSDVGAGVY